MEDNTLSLRYDNRFLVVESNELIRSKQDDLTLLEARLVRLLVAQIKKDDTELKTYTCNVSELADFLGMDRHNIYREMDKLTTSLMRKMIYIRSKKPGKSGKNNYIKLHWISFVQYADGMLTIRLSEDAKPFLIGLKGYWAGYEYGVANYLPSNNVMRLFELLWSFVNMTLQPDYVRPANYFPFHVEKNEFAFSIEYLRELLNCEDKYPNTGDFLKRTIDPYLKIIKENTTLAVSYRKVKQGRAITYLVFRLNDSADFDPTLILRLIKELEEERGPSPLYEQR